MKILDFKKFNETIKFSDYPNIKIGSNFNIIDEKDNYDYNCIAYTLGSKNHTIYPIISHQWIWPFPISNNVLDNIELSNFYKFYSLFGYKPCRNGLYEPDYDKVALYTHNATYFEHAAIQKDNKWWISKMGENELFEHTLYALFNNNISRKVFFLEDQKMLISIINQLLNLFINLILIYNDYNHLTYLLV